MTTTQGAQTLDVLNRQGNILDGIKIKPLTFTPPEVQPVTIDDAAQLYVLSDNSLPIVNLQLVFEGGSDAEKTDFGVTSALAAHLKLGGAGDRSGEQIAEELASLGASLEIAAASNSFVITLSSLSGDFEKAFQILEDVLLRPKFDESVLPVIQTSMKTVIQRRNDKPESIAQRKVLEVSYLPGRRGYSLTLNDIDNLNVGKIKNAYQSLFANRSLYIALSGQIPENTENQIRHLVKAMPKVSAPYRNYDQQQNQTGITDLQNKILLVNKNVSQAVVTLTTSLPAHNDADYYALQTENYILGGGSFVSRLMQEVRAKRGLAYYSYSRNTFESRFGRFTAASGTRADQAADTLTVMLEVINGMNSISNDELQLAKDSIINSLVFEYDNPSRFLSQKIRQKIHQMPADFEQQFANNINRLTKEQVQKVATKYIDTNKMWIIVVGPASLKSELEKIRPVVVVEPEEKLIK